MTLYLNIDGVLLHNKENRAAEHAAELIEYITSEFDCYWLTTHCKGESKSTIEYLSGYFPPETIEELKKIKPTYWENIKTEGVDFDCNFIWLEDSPSEAEIDVLKHFGSSKSLYRVDLQNENELANVLTYLKDIKARRRKRRIRAIYVILGLFLSIVIGKAIWMGIANRNIDTFATEREDILGRRNYLIEKVITEPKKLLAAMPKVVGPQFQGEWALYSASMLSAALTNIAEIYPETREESIKYIDSLIQIVMSSEIRQYDAERWGEDPLRTLDGDKSHISYLSHLAWMISGYKHIDGGGKYDRIYHQLCETMNRRILQSPNLNLPTYPNEYIYVPDMLVAIVALANYSRQYNGKYSSTVHSWLEEMQINWIDENSGLLMSFIPNGDSGCKLPAKGSYSALSCYYLTFVDEEFAHQQYEHLKKNFYQKRPIAGFKEYYDRRCLLGFDIDAGPILFNLSPTGTAFGIGPATFLNDYDVRTSFLKTAELAGFTVSSNSNRHYLLANMALVGEAITLAMRTTVRWQ